MEMPRLYEGRRDALGDSGVVDGVAVDLEEMTPSTLLLHILPTPESRTPVLGQMKDGDLGFGVVRWEGLRLDIWLAIEDRGSINPRKEIAHGLAAVVVEAAGGIRHLDQADLVRGPRRDTRVQGLDRHHEDSDIRTWTTQAMGFPEIVICGIVISYSSRTQQGQASLIWTH